MEVRLLPKTGALRLIGLSVLLSVLVLAGILARNVPETSAKRPSATILQPKQAITSRQVGSSVRSTDKKKRVSPFLAAAVPTVTAPAKPVLLAAVQQPDIRPEHQKLADSVLRSLPPGCRDNLKNFFIRYKDATRRGLGGKTTIILDGSVPDTELAALLVHECAHVIHGNMQGTAASGVSAFADGKEVFYKDSPIAAFFSISWSAETVRKAGAKDGDFASGYGKSDAFEDFAETFALYILHRDAFEERAQTNAVMAAKLQWMNTYLPTPESALGASGYNWDKKVPWDITKLVYSLKAL